MRRVSDELLRNIEAGGQTPLKLGISMARELRAAREVVEAARRADSCHRQNQKLELADALQGLTRVLTAHDAPEDGN